jgi:hypothetical protein
MVATSATHLDTVYRVTGYAVVVLAPCVTCCGCGLQDYGRYALPCETCGGSGQRPDPRLQDLPKLSIVAEAA